MEPNVRVVNAAYAAFARGDIVGLLKLVDEDVSWVSPRTLPQGGAYQGKIAVAKFFEIVADSWSALRLTVDSISAIDRERVVGVTRLDGRRGGVDNGYGAVHVVRVRLNRIASFREYVDVDNTIR